MESANKVVAEQLKAANQPETLLEAEEVEQVIAPRLASNHNETMLEAEEVEQVIAPRVSGNHNETFL